MTNDELISILTDSLLGATAVERQLLHTVIERNKISKVNVSSKSESSLKLRQMVEDHSNVLSREIIRTFESCEIYCIDEPICNAFAKHTGGGKIIVFDGLLQIIKFYINIVKILQLFDLYKPKRQDERDDLGTAGFALLVNFILTGESLPEIKNVLPPNFENDANIGFLVSILFVLCHEAAHLILGHTKLTSRSELRLGNLRLDENVDEEKIKEFEADEYAFFAFDEDSRDYFISSIIFFFGAFSFAETFCSSNENMHPLAANRIVRLAGFTRFPNDPQAQQATFDIVEGELNRYNRLSDYRRVNEDQGRGHIKEIMPTDEALNTFNRILTTIKDKNYFSQIVSDTNL